MSPTISVIVGIFGDVKRWRSVADERAVPSIAAQTVKAADVQVVVGLDLAQARNVGAARATGDWLCFLDADDELDAEYLAAMTATIETLPPGDWLLQPATLGVVDGHEDAFPVLIPRKPLIDGNFMVIGTLVRRDQFRRVGGFDDYPYAEDWELWLRCWIDGAQFLAVPDAVYRVHVNPLGRNSVDRDLQLRTYHEIRNRHLAAARARKP